MGLSRVACERWSEFPDDPRCPYRALNIAPRFLIFGEHSLKTAHLPRDAFQASGRMAS